MSTPDPLVQFIRLRLYDDQLAAEQATGDWPDGDEVAGEVKSIWVGAHVVRHDPARVLRGVQAKRGLLDEIFRYEAAIDSEWACCHEANEIAAGLCGSTRPEEILSLRLLASEWSDHADYRAEWTP